MGEPARQHKSGRHLPIFLQAPDVAWSLYGISRTRALFDMVKSPKSRARQNVSPCRFSRFLQRNFRYLIGNPKSDTLSLLSLFAAG